jgi:hypothetical protein
MYTVENNIHSLQDVVEHISNISKVEVLIENEFCKIIAIKGGLTKIEGAFCFQNEDIYQHCSQFISEAIDGVLSDNYFDELC